MGQENGFFDNPVSVIFHWSADPNAVGDCRRRAFPASGFYGQKQMREHLISLLINDKRWTFRPVPRAGLTFFYTYI